MTVLVVPIDHALCFVSSYVKPFAGVGQIVILDGQIFGQYTLAVWKSVRVWTKQPIFLVLVLVIAVSGGKYVVVELHHRYNSGVQQILGGCYFGIAILPYSRQHVGPIHCHISHYLEPFL